MREFKIIYTNGRHLKYQMHINNKIQFSYRSTDLATQADLKINLECSEHNVSSRIISSLTRVKHRKINNTAKLNPLSGGIIYHSVQLINPKPALMLFINAS